ncbi:phosphotransferase enzyme family protein [Mycobacterium lacus]|uniref:phosphotransferase enzyme family protein n=1 Tax=Mycobacterium lacus TaxID=169765 RepID=UPI0013D2BB37|nr:phosphotransferase [Mycobacterium lacus]MCV7123315.1 phosphotransferase [Mycobacterium lacus]
MAAAESMLRLGEVEVLDPAPHAWGSRRLWRVQSNTRRLVAKFWSGRQVRRLRAEAMLAASAASEASPIVAPAAAIGWGEGPPKTLLHSRSHYLENDPDVWRACTHAASFYRLLGGAHASGADAHALGRALAQLHQVFRHTTLPVGPRWPALCQASLPNPQPGAPIIVAQQRIRQRAKELAAMPTTVVHGDARYDNAIRVDRGVIVLIDLEFCRRDSSLFDLASLVAPTRTTDGNFQMATAAELAQATQGYESIAGDLSRACWALLPTVVLAHYAIVAMDLRTRPTENLHVLQLVSDLLEQIDDLIADVRRLVV